MNAQLPCPVCDANASVVKERFDVTLGARRVAIDAERYRCDECGEAFYTPDQMDHAQSAASIEIRRREELLLPNEIRAIRAQFDLTLPAFERLLRVGPKTAIRWEHGTVFQNRATDQLMRVMRDVPAVYAYLAAQIGVVPAVGSEPSLANRVPQQKYGAPAAVVEQVVSGVVDINAWRTKPNNSRPVTPSADLPPLSQEALK